MLAANTHMGDIFPRQRSSRLGPGHAPVNGAPGRCRPQGHLISVERRQDFADTPRRMDSGSDAATPRGDLRASATSTRCCGPPEQGSGTVVPDMLAWENIEAITHALIPGGVLVC